ncbi:hypothetical protein AGABI2DRAFT_208153 [Agaricus bisporus var. bisporus H97]|nr:hypothetical protein AGABI2DRAFT_208153 [Agaricus bisporus var. bisporus H97]EKV45254.1 hypothetical protein AGABI2DRAFT_208153 [Agaricus bisporus var. bisporus H97]
MKIEGEFQNQRVVTDESPGSLSPITVDMYIHVISANGTTSGGNVSDSQIVQQMTVLNADYQTMNIDFKLVNVTRTVNQDWFGVKPDSTQQTEMKQRLRQGGPGDLNVYLSRLEPPGLLGYSTFPKDVGNLEEDGVVILHSSLPGGTTEPYNEGRTLTHEVGHWLGLYHTFQGGCTDPGDMVDDTPSEAKPGYGCPEGRKSCPLSIGIDLIHNFMDYGEDGCLNSFTPGQTVRVRQQISHFRRLAAKQGSQNSGKHHRGRRWGQRRDVY